MERAYAAVAMTRRNLFQAGALTAGTIAASSILTGTANANPGQDVVYISPHQDDETLAMGASIANHAAAGYRVHVLLLSNGINSGARTRVNLTRSQFTDARDDELRRAAQHLGVPAHRVHISRHTTEDGQLSVRAAEDSLNWFLDHHPDAWVKAYSPHAASGRHSDHINAGLAAANLHHSGRVTNLRHYVEPWLIAGFRAAHPWIRLGEERPTNLAAVHAAYDSYGQGYGIGHISVPAFFQSGRANPVNYWHVP